MSERDNDMMLPFMGVNELALPESFVTHKEEDDPFLLSGFESKASEDKAYLFDSLSFGGSLLGETPVPDESTADDSGSDLSRDGNNSVDSDLLSSSLHSSPAMLASHYSHPPPQFVTRAPLALPLLQQERSHSRSSSSDSSFSLSTRSATQRVMPRTNKKKRKSFLQQIREQEDDEEDLSGLDKKERNKKSAAKYRKRRKMYVTNLENKMNECEALIDE